VLRADAAVMTCAPAHGRSPDPVAATRHTPRSRRRPPAVRLWSPPRRRPPALDLVVGVAEAGEERLGRHLWRAIGEGDEHDAMAIQRLPIPGAVLAHGGAAAVRWPEGAGAGRSHQPKTSSSSGLPERNTLANWGMSLGHTASVVDQDIDVAEALARWIDSSFDGCHVRHAERQGQPPIISLAQRGNQPLRLRPVANQRSLPPEPEAWRPSTAAD